MGEPKALASRRLNLKKLYRLRARYRRKQATRLQTAEKKAPCDVINEAAYKYEALNNTAAASIDNTCKSTVPAETGLSAEEEHAFRGSIQIPGTSKCVMVFPHSGSVISPEFCDRYREVVNLFRENTEEHPQLRHHVQHIDYGLKMCGASAQESHPSILVFCRPSEFEALQKLLNCQRLKEQYCLRKSSTPYSWKKWWKGREETRPAIERPLFAIYFWRKQRPRDLLCRETASVFIETGGNAQIANAPCVLSLVGAKATLSPGSARSSTLGCVLSVDSSFYCLTASHGLHGLETAAHPKLSSVDKESTYICTTQNSAQDSAQKAMSESAGTMGPLFEDIFADTDSQETRDDGDSFFSEPDYESMSDQDLDEQDTEESAAKTETTYAHYGQNSLTAPAETTIPGVAASHAIFPNSNCPAWSDMPDLDWALVHLKNKEQWHPNLFSTSRTGDLKRTAFPSEVASKCPDKETEVFIVTCGFAPKRGRIQPIPAFLGGICGKSTKASEVWTVAVSSENQLKKGDSGSIVVDAETFTIYGHVIGSNALGEIYISPLTTVLDQVKICLSATNVSLPTPLSLLAHQASLQLRARNSMAFRMLEMLDFLIQSMANKRDWSSLMTWGSSNHRDELLQLVDEVLPNTSDPEQAQILQKFSVLHSERRCELPNSRDAESSSISRVFSDSGCTTESASTDAESGTTEHLHLDDLSNIEDDSSATTKPKTSDQNDGNGLLDVEGTLAHVLPPSEYLSLQIGLNTSDKSTFYPSHSHSGESLPARDNIPEIRVSPGSTSARNVHSQSVDATGQCGQSDVPERPVQLEDIVQDTSLNDTHVKTHSKKTTSSFPRRNSIDEDIYYQESLTSRPSQPPSYESSLKAALAAGKKHEREENAVFAANPVHEDAPPSYSTDVRIEGVFMRKLEMEHAIKRVEMRVWQMVYVTLQGTALNVYNVKKERGWFSTKKKEARADSADNPAWIKKASLDKSYSLLHADCGIAADYKKRRYVIRLRAEADQFLLSCVELETFVRWLDMLFAAINIASPIDDRDFPIDQSVPRLQRTGWLLGRRHASADGEENLLALSERGRNPTISFAGEHRDREQIETQMLALPPANAGRDNVAPGRGTVARPAVSTSLTLPHPDVDPDTGKWVRPDWQWTAMHDLLYAKLCYRVLLFRSPRKSNYVVMNGERWFVDWVTRVMTRVLPPAYGETPGASDLTSGMLKQFYPS